MSSFTNHRNIPIFIPHMGCPNQCVFCNQRSISGCSSFVGLEGVREQIDSALTTLPAGGETEIAFFGGSFTGIDRGLMISLLELASGYVREGRVSSIRLSTRPDYISGEILEILSRFPVRNIELGLQSMDDSVLLSARRGHTAKQAADACRMVKDFGFSLVGQMMVGLPGATGASEIGTARRLVSLGVDGARIYPTVVFRDTPLARMTSEGVYTPLSVEEAVERSARALSFFDAAGIPVLRIGLCSGEGLTSSETVLAGPNHPALGELVLSRLWLDRMLLSASALGGEVREVIIYAPARFLSQIVGQHRSNIQAFEEKTRLHVRRIVTKDVKELSLIPLSHSKKEDNLPCI